MTARSGFIIFAVLALLITIFLHFGSANIPDPDSFYHIRHAWIYRTDSLLKTDFPWTQDSVIRLSAADLWYGLHIFLIPFTFFNNLWLGLKVAGVALTFLLLAGYGWVAKRHRLSLPYFWPLLVLFIAPDGLFQLTMVRPHLLSIIFGGLLLSFLIQGNVWAAAASGFAISFFHLNMFWFGLIIVGTTALLEIVLKFFPQRLITRLPSAEKWQIKSLAALAGLTFGWIARPNFLAAAHLVYVQVFQLLLEKQKAALLFANELQPFGLGELLKSAWPFIILLLGGLLFLIWKITAAKPRPINDRQFLFIAANLLISLLFVFLGIFIARRLLIPGLAFGSLFIGGVYTFYGTHSRQSSAMAAAIAVIALIAFPVSLYQYGQDMNTAAYPPDALQNAALWLKDHSNPGDVVFNSHWSYFPMLFFWNQKDYYINGMDPIFQYAYSPALSGEFQDVSTDQVAPENLYKILAKDFNARYIVLRPKRNPNLYDYLSGDQRFQKQFEDEQAAIFEIQK